MILPTPITRSNELLAHVTVFPIELGSNEIKKLPGEVICLVAPLLKYQTSDSTTNIHCSSEDGSKLQTVINAHSSFCTRFANSVFGVETSVATSFASLYLPLLQPNLDSSL